MKRNMLSAAIFLCLGMYVWNNFAAFDICLMLAVIAGYCFWCIRKKSYFAVLICLLAFVGGFLSIHFSNLQATEKSQQFLGKEVSIHGKVFEIQETDYGQRIYVKHNYTNSYGRKTNIKICVYLNDENYVMRYGDIISFSGNFKLPDSGSGWGGYNKRMSLRAEGVLLETTGKIKNISVAETDISKFDIFDLAYITKEFICKRVDTFFSEDVAGVIKGIIAGVDGEVSEEVEKSFRNSGVSHVLVASGMHINVIIIISMYILLALRIRQGKAMMIIQLLLVWFFVFMTGLELSAVRAGIVVTVLFFGKFISREADSLNSLGVAAVIMLLINPAVYFSLSFRLSFLSTGSILLFAKDIRKKLSILPGAAGESLAITIAAQIGTLLPISQSFGSMGAFGIFTNVLICPVITPIVAVSSLALALGNVPFFGEPIVWFANTIICGVIEVTKIVSSIPHSVIDVFSIRGIAVLVYALMCATAKLWLISKKALAYKCFVITMVLTCAVASYNVFCESTHITFLDTGSSDCTLLQNNELTIMFDGAGSDNYSVADSTIIPYMKKEGIRKIDVAFVTHYHTDHAGGIAELIERGRVKRVVVPVGIYKNNFKIYEAAQKAGIPLHYIGNFDKIKVGDIWVEGYNTFEGLQENNGFVYFVTYENNRICISGDVHKNGEKALLESGIPLKSDILKIPHHGSNTSGSEEFLKAVSPEYGVILRGDSKYPNEESEKLYKSIGIKYFSTNNHGNIRFYLAKSGKTRIKFGRNNFYELRSIKKAG